MFQFNLLFHFANFYHKRKSIHLLSSKIYRSESFRKFFGQFKWKIKILLNEWKSFNEFPSNSLLILPDLARPLIFLLRKKGDLITLPTFYNKFFLINTGTFSTIWGSTPKGSTYFPFKIFIPHFFIS